ncbi:MAG TPA: hypothetical protein VJT75_18515 [Thermoleophilaceae bacterium]|nr:hypothetical protein [Thermoleophilaceae bacterium]
MARTDSSTFDHYRTEVEAMLAVGRPLGSVERMLDRSALEEDERSALWLLAWSLGDHVGSSEPVEVTLVPDGPARP